MNTPIHRSPGQTGIPVLDDVPSPSTRVVVRHPLGLPAGSVRALLSLTILGLMWAVAVFSKGGQLPLYFVYLQYLMILILAHFFAAHGNSIGGSHNEGQPLGLPRGSIRFLLLSGFAGLVVWLLYHQTEFEKTPSAPIAMPLVLLSGFFLGYFLTKSLRWLSSGRLPNWFQDIEAWVAIVSMLGLVADVLIEMFINPTLTEEMRVNLEHLEAFLAAAVGFYFGARS